jgi:hypothetical protein
MVGRLAFEIEFPVTKVFYPPLFDPPFETVTTTKFLTEVNDTVHILANDGRTIILAQNSNVSNMWFEFNAKFVFTPYFACNELHQFPPYDIYDYEIRNYQTFDRITLSFSLAQNSLPSNSSRWIIWGKYANSTDFSGRESIFMLKEFRFEDLLLSLKQNQYVLDIVEPFQLNNVGRMFFYLSGLPLDRIYLGLSPALGNNDQLVLALDSAQFGFAQRFSDFWVDSNGLDICANETFKMAMKEYPLNIHTNYTEQLLFESIEPCPSLKCGYGFRTVSCDAKKVDCYCFDENYNGERCETCKLDRFRTCNSNGDVINCSACQCDEGWAGDHCDKCAFDRAHCSNHGEPDETCLNCICDGNWTSVSNCSVCGETIEMCNRNGKPDGTCTGKCVCRIGFSGEFCTETDPICEPPCANGGKCTENNICDCSTALFELTGLPFEGERCSEYSCTGDSVCLHDSECAGPGYCQCKDGFYGLRCENFTCFGLTESLMHLNYKKCYGGMGFCVDKDTCVGCPADLDASDPRFDLRFGQPDCRTPKCSDGCLNCALDIDNKTIICLHKMNAESPLDNNNIGLILSSIFAVLIVGGVTVILFILYSRLKRFYDSNGKSFDLPLQDGNAEKKHRNIMRAIMKKAIPSPMLVNFEEILVIEKLGTGKYGENYLATWKSIKCALKRVLKDDKKYIEDFHDVAQLMKTVPPHPNILEFLGVCEEPLCIIIEYCSNGNLLENLRKGNLNQGRKVTVAKEIAQGLQHLTSEGVTHRNVCAKNVFLFDHGAKITNFGFARINEISLASELAGNTVSGPLRWMAPEALNYRLFGERTDVWAYGVTLFEILTNGSVPYTDLMPLAVYSKVRANDVYLSLYIDNTLRDSTIYPVLDRCLDYEPLNRPKFEEIITFY